MRVGKGHNSLAIGKKTYIHPTSATFMRKERSLEGMTCTVRARVEGKRYGARGTSTHNSTREGGTRRGDLGLTLGCGGQEPNGRGRAGMRGETCFSSYLRWRASEASSGEIKVRGGYETVHQRAGNPGSEADSFGSHVLIGRRGKELDNRTLQSLAKAL